MSSPAPLKIGIVEDDRALIADLLGSITRSPRLTLSFIVSTVADALGVLGHSAPDVLLCDLGLPDGSGIQIIEHVARRHPRCEVLVLSAFADEDRVVRSIEAGGRGYVLKGHHGLDVDSAIEQLLEGGAPLTPGIARRLLQRLHRTGVAPASADPARPAETSVPAGAGGAGATHATERSNGPGTQPAAGAVDEDLRHERLTDREKQILNLISRGYTYSEIADLLGVRLHTVRTHIRNLYGKLSVHSRSEAIFEATQLGLIDWRV